MSDVFIRQIDPAGPTLGFELVGDDDLSGGVGGWQSLDRPRRTSAAVWTGTPARTYVLPLMLDGIEAGGVGRDTPVEAACGQLETWGRGDEATPPPVLQVTGLVIVPGTSRWVLQDLAWGGKERDGAGRRVQQLVTVTLLEYVAPVLLKSPAKKARGGRGGKGFGEGNGGKGGK